ncbi:MAG: M3 family oligoendopeptidase [Anaerolineae bacterium]|nr:M3 family oligoendopeptidase [Anaerolineae bacterium]
MNKTQSLPHWDMTTVFPGLDAPEFLAAFAAHQQTIRELVQHFDDNAVALCATPPDINDETIALFEDTLTRFNTMMTRQTLLSTYINCFVSVNSRNAIAQSRNSELALQRVEVNKLNTRLTAWLGSLDVATLIEKSPVAQAHAFMLRRVKREAQHLMSPVEENLAAELNLTGADAWTNLYDNYSSQITANVEIAGEMQTLPITAIRNLAHDADRQVRQRAYLAELKAWETHALPIAAAMNSIKGQTNTLSQRRGWGSPLDVALFNNNITRDVLEVMLDTAKTFYPTFRRYLKAKARALGLEQLSWYDLFAPVGEDRREWSFEISRDFIIREFGAFSPRMGDLAKRAFQERWIDAEPRDGKGGGAFCAWLRDDESRVFGNFSPDYGAMSMLAHELGHAYHNLTRAQCTYMQRRTPMTLAETASNFGEIIVREAALKTATPAEQTTILDASLQDATQVVVDIASRFLFETDVFEQRRERELSVETLNALMLDAQRATYGDGLNLEEQHPYMWAVKSHYYGSIFYNFPYMFGLLFSTGLYARYRQAPEGFLEAYDQLLAATGMDDAATLAARFDMDIRQPAFWQSSLEMIAADVARFEKLVAGTPKA